MSTGKNSMQVTDLTVEELKLLIQDTVTETLKSFLSSGDDTDPDEGLQLRPEVVSQLQDALKRTQAGKRGTPASVVASELGIKWDEL